jgi:hypothetical protein
MDFRSDVPGTWGVQNYKASSGSNWAWGKFSPITSESGRNSGDPDGLDHCNGFMCRNGHLEAPGSTLFITRKSDVTDGLSNTFAIGECVPEWSRHTWWAWFNATTATTAIPLNYQMQPDRQVENEGDWWHNASFMSRHPGGAHFGMVDGAARFVSENVDLLIYRELGTMQAKDGYADGSYQ